MRRERKKKYTTSNQNRRKWNYVYTQYIYGKLKVWLRKNEKPKMKIPSNKICRKERQTRRSCKTERKSITFNTGCNYQHNNCINEKIKWWSAPQHNCLIFLSVCLSVCLFVCFNCKPIQLASLFHCISLYNLIFFSVWWYLFIIYRVIF